MPTEITKSNDGAQPTSAQMALAILVERVQSLSEDDRQDLYELSKLIYSDDCEEVASAQAAMLEILEQERSAVTRLQAADMPGEKLTGWIKYVSEKIKQLRKTAGLTQEELEAKTGIPQSHISRLENGQHSPSFITLEKIAQALEVNVSALEPSISALESPHETNNEDSCGS